MKEFSLKEARKIGEELGCDWEKWSVEDLKKGMDHELEHGKVSKKYNVTNDDPELTAKIALAHLEEMPDYYEQLDAMEDSMEDFKRTLL